MVQGSRKQLHYKLERIIENIRLGDGLKTVGLSVAVNGADGVDCAGRSGGVCSRNDLTVVASDGGADLSLDVLRKGSDNGVSAGGAVGWRDGCCAAACRCLVSWCNGDIDCLGFPFNDFTAAATGHISSG